MRKPIPTKIERARQQLVGIDADQMQAVWNDLNELYEEGATPEIKREAYKARLWLGRIIDRVELAQGGPLDAEIGFTWNSPPEQEAT